MHDISRIYDVWQVAVQLMAYMQREAQIVAQMETIGEDEA